MMSVLRLSWWARQKCDLGVQRPELATIVFYNVRKPELNKIAMGFLFHRLAILGRAVTDLDKQTEAAQTASAETTPLPST